MESNQDSVKSDGSRTKVGATALSQERLELAESLAMLIVRLHRLQEREHSSEPSKNPIDLGLEM